tara:strand:- start:152 stop:271 length:120 start_codon:yes stop_codon:yes gene_type:complete
MEIVTCAKAELRVMLASVLHIASIQLKELRELGFARVVV